MIVSFFGHSDFVPNEAIKYRLANILNDIVGNFDVKFYLGGYGGFDNFAYGCCREFKKMHENSRLMLVTPYLNMSKRFAAVASDYDEVIYPPLEEVIPKYAIYERNKWMVSSAGVVICYVNHAWGGAYTACKNCVLHGKQIVNLGTFDFEQK